MLTWIVTSACVGTLSAVTLHLFQECDEAPCPSPDDSSLWRTMTDEELNALVEEFARAAEPASEPPQALAA